ncbi:MAG: hypothetical protein AABY53_09295, partial [Bdellovibrionota bacterium]
VARAELKPAYDQHRKLIVELVEAATSNYTAVEAAAQAKAKAGDTKDIVLRGPLYTKVIQMKDLIADILPPPKYIIESYLTALQAVDALEGGQKDEAKKLLEYGTSLRSGGKGVTGYNERHDYWVKNLEEKTIPEKKIKDLMVKLTHDPAQKFYDTRDAKLSAAINSGNVADAKNIIRNELKPAYDEHRKNIDDLVSRANKVYLQLEAEVAQQLSNQ